MAVESTFDWRSLGAVPPMSLGPARLEAHIGASLAAAVGRALATPVDDSDHVSLRWRSDERILHGVRVGRLRPVSAAFRPARSELVVRDGGDGTIGSLALEGRTVEEARSWLTAALAALEPGSSGAALELASPPVGSADHEFEKPGLGALEIDAWLGNAAALLEETRIAAGPEASPVRCWPHHFDIATLVTLDPDTDAEAARSIGIGLSMGDDATPQPYWYVNIWPAPSAPDLHPLPVGSWITDGWLGAILTGEEIVAAGTAREQERLTRVFLGAAVDAAGAVLDGT